MLLNLISAVLLASSLHALLSLIGASGTALTPAGMALSGMFGDPVTVAIINSAINASTFVYSAHSYSPMFVDTPGWNFADALSWDRYIHSKDKYIFRNQDNGYWLSVDYEGEPPYILYTQDHMEPTVFAVESVGDGDFVIKLPYFDSVFEAVYDNENGENPHPWYAWVELRPANGSAYQQWKIKTQPEKIVTGT
ncbi:hypothetical protein B0H16DRAFT_1717603 [Mycena metata]|uniref:Uncharacterized protein n=1 Tax=Mycena metata TaxID=1033252 RepID=A0AAD7NL34_9AGAR|nr:hypothetical protein B0H16DRAFT_1717603 [Mycena metata]